MQGRTGCPLGRMRPVPLLSTTHDNRARSIIALPGKARHIFDATPAHARTVRDAEGSVAMSTGTAPNDARTTTTLPAPQTRSAEELRAIADGVWAALHVVSPQGIEST